MPDLGGRPSMHRVFGLVDEFSGKMLYIGVASGKSTWENLWREKEHVQGNPLAELFRSISARPREVLLLGSVGVPQSLAYQVAALLATWFKGCLVETPRRGGNPRGRPVSHIENGRIQVFPSRVAAAKAAGVCVKTMTRRVRLGGAWLDGEVRDG